MAQLVQFIDVELSPQDTATFLEARFDDRQAWGRLVRGGPELALVAQRHSGAPSLAEIRLAPHHDGGTHVVYRERDLGIVALCMGLIAFATARLRAGSRRTLQRREGVSGSSVSAPTR